jgi:hypothetical protein
MNENNQSAYYGWHYRLWNETPQLPFQLSAKIIILEVLHVGTGRLVLWRPPQKHNWWLWSTMNNTINEYIYAMFFSWENDVASISEKYIFVGIEILNGVLNDKKNTDIDALANYFCHPHPWMAAVITLSKCFGTFCISKGSANWWRRMGRKRKCVF